MRKLSIVAILLVILVSLPVAAQTSKPSGPPCSVDRLAGDWAALSLGLFGQSDSISTGTFHLNKDGTSSAHIWINVGGSSFFELDRFGNTTVNEDCTMTQTWNDGGPLAKCVILDDGNEMWCIYDQPAFIRVTLKRIHTRN
jgi:hypothetical protein